MKPVLSVIGIGMVILGFFGVGRVAWLGWVDITVGVLALLASTAKLPRSTGYTGVALGIATLVFWIVALATGVAPWLTWLTFVGGVAFVLSSPMVTRPTLPPGRGPGPHFPR
jgi:hypothetical protein